MILKRHSLTWKQTYLVLVTVLCFATTIFCIELISSLITEKQKIVQQKKQLINGFQDLASEHAQTSDIQWAEYIIERSLNQAWVSAAHIELSSNGQQISASKPNKQPNKIIDELSLLLLSNLPEDPELIYRYSGLSVEKVSLSNQVAPFARLSLSYNRQLITKQLIQHLKRIFTITMLSALVLTIALSYVFHHFLTLPIIKLSEAIEEINPDDPKDKLLPNVQYHKKNELGGLVSKFNQILLQFDTTQVKLRKLATKDPLTNLPNRTLLLESIAIAMQRSRTQRRNFAILFIDLDRFKTVNDSLGHTLGDRYLIRISRVLKRFIGERGTVARIGGDEFVILANDIQTPTQAAELANKLLKQIKKPLQLNEHLLHPNASVGISLFPEDGRTAENLIHHADTAMYSAKAKGLGNWSFFSKKMTEIATTTLKIETDLHYALRHKQFSLFYQPKINLKTGELSSCEALIRWHKGSKLISPAKFIPIAEESGIIINLGKWVIKQACKTLAAWKKRHNTVPRIAVNVAAKQFIDPTLVSFFQTMISHYNIPAELLEIEITEGSFIDDIQMAIDKIEQLKRLGFRIAIDDFGTGYSSLSYLKVLPVDTLKIDRAFIEGLPENDALASTILMLGKQMNFEIVAEGIDEKNQLNWLKQHDCQTGQGFLFSRPLNQADFEEQYLSPRQTTLDIC
ncbi:MAG: EAL domain-containing protein [Parashewanella sp.]